MKSEHRDSTHRSTSHSRGARRRASNELPTRAAAALFALACYAAVACSQDSPNDPELTFEAGVAGSAPRGWGGGPSETLHYDQEVRHSGDASARIERSVSSAQDFSTFTKRVPVEFSGRVIEWRGYLRTQDVTDYAGLWLRMDGASGSLGFRNLGAAALSGTTDWKQYSLSLELDAKAREIYFGFLLSGSGTAWGDDFELLVDGVPYQQAPRAERKATVLDTDTEFSGGSGIEQEQVAALSEQQIEDLATLGEIWGFLKYHHPRIARGEVHWDYELFRVLPEVLAAADTSQRNQRLLAWARKLGGPPKCEPCAELPEDLHLAPDHGWFERRELGDELRGYLHSVLENRNTSDEHFYLGLVRGVGNPIFENELAYLSTDVPDAGYRLLALFRLWAIIEYWFPYRDLLDEDWSETLREFVPRLAGAETRDDYQLQLLALIARVKDTHANLWSSLHVRPPVGQCQVPVDLRFVDERAVVTSLRLQEQGNLQGTLQRGDVIEAIAGDEVSALVPSWAPFYAASNWPTRLRDIARSLTRGACGPVALRIRRGEEVLDIEATRTAIAGAPRFHDRAGDTFQMLSDEVAYLKLSSVQSADLDDYMERAAEARGFVVDIRNYPSDFVVFTVGGRFVDEAVEFVRFTGANVPNPGAFEWSPSLQVAPVRPGFAGKVAILVDEVSQSNAEYTAMALRAGPRAVVIGSTTAGADGNVSAIPLPGGLRTMISGIGVFYPDKRATQRVGIVPDIEARPTLEGIREGRDEVLEVALREILGSEAEETEIRGMAKRP